MPEFGLLALISIGATMTLGVIGLYERVYRPRIEKNKDKLLRYANAELKSLVRRIKIPADSETMEDFSNELNWLNKLVKRPGDFLEWRKYLLISLVALGIAVGYGVYNPTELISDYPAYAWCILLFVINLIANGYYLYEVWNIDNNISEISQTTTSEK